MVLIISLRFFEKKKSKKNLSDLTERHSEKEEKSFSLIFKTFLNCGKISLTKENKPLNGGKTSLIDGNNSLIGKNSCLIKEKKRLTTENKPLINENNFLKNERQSLIEENCFLTAVLKKNNLFLSLKGD